ncbi:hypothetical conserved protein [Novosphingobium sp. MBES04]|nr:hypothetical conserved protein [Novosphingobium sp. MBES04]
MTESAEMIEGKGAPAGGACVDTDFAEVDSGDKALILLQTMICYLREKNILSRADIEVLRERVEARMEDARAEKAVRAEASGSADLPCDAAIARAAAREMRELDEYCGKRYGGKHRRRVN